MTTLNKPKKIRVNEIFAENLALRGNANYLFDTVESLPEKEIIIDFTDVVSISRSFAHQYTLRKEGNMKKIIDVGKCNDVKKMFDLVKKKRGIREVFDITNIKIKRCSHFHNQTHLSKMC